jgi:hypothetical protein
VKAAITGIRTLTDYSVWLKDHQHTRFYFLQNKGTTYRAELLHYLIFHPMNLEKDLPPRLDKYHLLVEGSPSSLLSHDHCSASSPYYMHSHVSIIVRFCSYLSSRMNTCSSLMHEPILYYKHSLVFLYYLHIFMYCALGTFHYCLGRIL